MQTSSNPDTSVNSSTNHKRFQTAEPMKKILLVEDDPITQDVIKLFLKGLYIVDIASNAISALKFAHQHKYYAVLMDINLGKGKNGIEVTKEIRKISGCERLPIIAETAFAMKGDKEEFLAAGCNYYISKPFNKEEIRNLLASLE